MFLTRLCRPSCILILSLVAAGCAGTHGPAIPDTRPVPQLTAGELARVKRQLDSIDVEDQRYRAQQEYIAGTAGGESAAMQALLDSMQYADSLNMIAVARIIDAYGWLGADAIGADANTTLFMVIQHSPLSNQQKYLPLMRRAVAEGKARGGSLALLEDRVALREGRKQRYGSQLSWNMNTNVYYVLPIDYPDSVDLRRAGLGLPPMATYILDCCNLVWDVEAYKKDIRSLKVKE